MDAFGSFKLLKWRYCSSRWWTFGLVKRYLVTTADERTWPKDGTVIFLGEWCRLFNRRLYWEKLDAEVVPYHWDDRKKFYKDYQYLKNLHEKLLTEISVQLNLIHGVNHSVKYWRILIGPWLGFFVQVLFDRWTMLKHAITKYDVDCCKIIYRDYLSVTPDNIDHFNEMCKEDDWNEAIYAQLLKLYFSDLVDLENITDGSSFIARQHKTGWKIKLKRYAYGVLRGANHLFARQNQYFFISTALPFLQNFKLQINLGQTPKYWEKVEPVRVDADIVMRDWEWGSIDDDEFNTIVRKMIPLHIPTLYLEGYIKLQNQVSSLLWPSTPKAIFTSNSYNSDDIFKAWAAEKCENNVPLIIGQHGGHFGMGIWAFYEEHQIDIADTWLSWGWSDKNQPHIVPIGFIIGIKRYVSYNPQGGVVMSEMGVSRYSTHLLAMPIASQWLDYFDDQTRFVVGLKNEVKANFRVRLYMHDYGWGQRERWLDKVPDIQFNKNDQPIHKLLTNCRLYISTYNATTHLESLAWNVPTVMFWNPEHWELKPEAEEFFKLLESVGIFHRTPESAAKQVNKVWDNVPAWWESDEVQQARKEFCWQYSRHTDDVIKNLEATLCGTSNTFV